MALGQGFGGTSPAQLAENERLQDRRGARDKARREEGRTRQRSQDESRRSQAETSRITRQRQSPKDILALLDGPGGGGTNVAGGGTGRIPGSAGAAVGGGGGAAPFVGSGQGGGAVVGPSAADTAFSREKERVGEVSQSALRGLNETLNARGIRGPAAGAQLSNVFQEGVGQLGEFSRDQVLESSQRQEREQFQGRELDSQRRAQSIQALLGILNQQGGLF